MPDDLTLPEFVLQNAEAYHDKVAFVEAATGKEYTYGQISRDVKRFANALRSLSLRKGRGVVVVLPNVAEYEIKKQVETAEAKLIITDASTYNNKVKGLDVAVVLLGEERAEGTVQYDELLEATDRANTNSVKEKVHQTD